MAPVAAHPIALDVGYGRIFHPEASCGRHLGQRRTCQIQTMAGLAAVLVCFVGILVAVVIPAGIIHDVQAMGAPGGRWQAARCMADGTFDDGAGVSLKLLGRLVVIGIAGIIGPDGVGAAVAVFTGDPAMPLAEAKERVRIFRKTRVEGQQRGCRIIACGKGLPQAEGPIGIGHQVEWGGGVERTSTASPVWQD